MTEEEIRVKMGSNVRPRKKLWQQSPEMPATGIVNGRGIPRNFDARKHWPHCTVIKKIKDQSVCGGCWAVAAAAAYSDRKCIFSKQKTNFEYSAEDILTCCVKCKSKEQKGDGCRGGYVDEAFNFINEYGVVTGGDFGSQNTCKPYSFSPCGSSKDNKCPKARSNKCQLKCSNKNYKYPYKIDKRFGRRAYSINNKSEFVQSDIMDYGPVVASFKTCYDFRHYKKGVYFHVYGSCEQTYHAVIVIGWGEENSRKYWLVLNTWNYTWGDYGSFKILQTDNNCDFGHFTAAVPYK